MISYQSNYFEVVISMSQVSMKLNPPPQREGGVGGDCSIDPSTASKDTLSL